MLHQRQTRKSLRIPTVRHSLTSTRYAVFLISTNDKTVKMWKVKNKPLVEQVNLNLVRPAVPERDEDEMDLDDEVQVHREHAPRPEKKIANLKIPKMDKSGQMVTTARPRHVYGNAHAYHINSIAVNSDGETFLSADDLRINLWNVDTTKQSFNVVDIKPENMEELTEVITAAEFHPTSCNIFMFSSSRGSIKLGDLRESALCDTQAKLFEASESDADKSFFSEIIASISDVKFTNDGRHILSRDVSRKQGCDEGEKREYRSLCCNSQHFPTSISDPFVSCACLTVPHAQSLGR